MTDDLRPGREAQSAASVLMVRPACFAFNPQTAASNAFQHAGTAPAMREALAEFDAAAACLAVAGMEVIIAEDDAQPAKPDAIFPNNWVSFHADGSVVLYPMLAPNRRAERREAILEQVAREGSFRITRTIDLTLHETAGKYLEGTGSVVLDRARRIAYAGMSPRTDLDVLADFARRLDYDPVSFDAADADGQPVYHTNVLLAVGTRFAIVCSEAIDAPARAGVLARLGADGQDVVQISRAQMQCFAGNALELAPRGGPVLALSTGALQSLLPAQRRVLESHATLLPLSIATIEHVGGGGVRCLLAEIHLPRRTGAADIIATC